MRCKISFDNRYTRYIYKTVMEGYISRFRSILGKKIWGTHRGNLLTYVNYKGFPKINLHRICPKNFTKVLAVDLRSFVVARATFKYTNYYDVFIIRSFYGVVGGLQKCIVSICTIKVYSSIPSTHKICFRTTPLW